MTVSPAHISAGLGFEVNEEVNEETTLTKAIFDTWEGEEVPVHERPLNSGVANLLNSVVEVSCPLGGL